MGKIYSGHNYFILSVNVVTVPSHNYVRWLDILVNILYYSLLHKLLSYWVHIRWFDLIESTSCMFILQGNLLVDILLAWWCELCTLTQEAQEVKSLTAASMSRE